jgi:hypothetical protein
LKTLYNEFKEQKIEVIKQQLQPRTTLEIYQMIMSNLISKNNIMELYNFTNICKSCGRPLSKNFLYCYKCNTSNVLVQCTYKKKSSNKQCHLKSIKGRCIFHFKVKLIIAQLLIEQRTIPKLNGKQESKPKILYEFLSDDEN